MATIISVGVRASLVSLDASCVRRSILYASTPRLQSLKPAALSFRASSSQKINIVAEEAAPKKTGRGITKPKPVSPALQDFLGVKEIPRTQALKQIWAYIKERNLQDPNNKKIIVCDEKLKSIFGGRDQIQHLSSVRSRANLKLCSTPSKYFYFDLLTNLLQHSPSPRHVGPQIMLSKPMSFMRIIYKVIPEPELPIVLKKHIFSVYSPI